MPWEPLYVDAATLADWNRANDGADDDECALAAAGASRAIDRRCSGNLPRQFGKVDAPEVRTYRSRRLYRGRRWFDVDDLHTEAGLLVDGGTVTDVELWPANAAQRGRPWEAILLPTSAACELDITGGWGWAAYPEAVELAARIQGSRFLARRDSPFGVAGSPDLGNELRLLARLDPDVAVTLAPYVRPGGMG